MDNNVATSEWSTGCESGWTVYLDDSYIPRNDTLIHHPQSYRINSARNDDDDNDDNDEDLSMVSDASSGPPHFYVQGDDEQSYSHSISKNCYYSKTSEKSSKKNNDKRLKKSNKDHKKKLSANKHQQYHLDDTASSPAISTYSKMYDNASNMGLSQNFSLTHFEGNSSYSNHYSFWQSSHVNETNYSNEPGEFISGRGWE